MQYGGTTRGFTIVELLIVIVVIAVLAAIATVAYTGIQRRAYENRASSELSSIARAIQLYHADRGEYPTDVDRGVPVAIFDYSGNDNAPSDWPNGPWPGSVYDYDTFVAGSDRAVQISIRFCPLNENIPCQFPSESWAAGFDRQSSAYWCITGPCRAHPDNPLAIGHQLN